MRTIYCNRCNIQMNYLDTKKIQLGQTGWFLGDLPNLLAGSMEIEIYTCSKCGVVEFFQPEQKSDSGIALVQCPKCGKKHDIDYPKCPFCKHNYLNE